MARHLHSNRPMIPLTSSQYLLQADPQQGSKIQCSFRFVPFPVPQRASSYSRGKCAKLQTLLGQKFTCVFINACDSFQLMNVIYHLLSCDLIWFWIEPAEKLV